MESLVQFIALISGEAEIFVCLKLNIMDGLNAKLSLREFSRTPFYTATGSCPHLGKWGIGVCLVITVTPREGKYLSVVRGRNGEPSEPCAGQLRVDWGWSVHIQQPACSWSMQVTGCYALMPSLAEMLPKSGARFVSLHHTTPLNPLPKSEKKFSILPRNTQQPPSLGFSLRHVLS